MVAGVGGGVVLAWLLVLAAVWWTGYRDEARPADAIVVLGAAQYDGRPSPVLKARLDHAVRLWQQGLAAHLILTGGRRAGDRTTEAAAGRRYVVGQGVPDSAVLLESEGQSTSASLRAVAVLLRELRRTDPTAGTASAGTLSAGAGTAGDAWPTAVLVSDPFHMLRLSVLARRYGIAAYTSPTRTSPISANTRLAWSYLLRETLKVPVAFFTHPPDDD